MARDAGTVQTISDSAGLSATFTAFVQSNGGSYDNTAQTAWVVFRNENATARTVTISTDKTLTPQAVATTSATFTVAGKGANVASYTALPVLQNQWWAQDGTNTIYVDVDVDTDLYWAVVAPA